jgi:hypothetical protein
MVYETEDVSHVAEVVWPHVAQGECNEALSQVLSGTGIGFHYLPDGVVRIFKLSDKVKRLSGVTVASSGKPLKGVKIVSESGVYTYSRADGAFTFDFPATDSQIWGYYGHKVVGKVTADQVSDVRLVVNFKEKS